VKKEDGGKKRKEIKERRGIGNSLAKTSFLLTTATPWKMSSIGHQMIFHDRQGTTAISNQELPLAISFYSFNQSYTVLF